MGPVPDTFTLDRFVGQQLQEVGVGEFVLNLRFHHPDSITCEGELILREVGQVDVTLFGDELGDLGALRRIVGKTVTAWKIESSHCFSISFDDGVSLLFTSRDHPYEDFVVRPEIQVV